tara:strand:- start:104 stop:736 length:633 start_codon:yes stop_codon:yes gene_type:complete
MKPWLSKNDEKMFYRYLNNSSVYFEYGSGGSTYQASIRNNIVKIYSVESDITWQNKLRYALTNNKDDHNYCLWKNKQKHVINNSNIKFIFNEMNTRPNNFGYPGKNASDTQKKNYSNHIINLNKEQQSSIDFVFIDGRFRVACCLKCYDIIKNNCLIAFDDFLNRPQYHIVLEYFDIIEKTIDNRMVILKKKANVNISKEVIEKYELIAF